MPATKETATHVPVKRLCPNPWGVEVGPRCPMRTTG
jgi:hypothetical protein